MQFLYILTLNEKYHDSNNWTEETNTLLGLHFNYLKDNHEKGVMKHVGRTDLPYGDNSLHGYVIFEAENEAAAHSIMNNDPAVSSGIMRAQLLPYIIVFGK